MVRKTIYEKEIETIQKKYCGIFKNVLPVIPYGSLRIIVISTDDGEKHFLQAHFRTLEREEKGINLGDRIEVDYKDYDNFTMKKLEGKEK